MLPHKGGGRITSRAHDGTCSPPGLLPACLTYQKKARSSRALTHRDLATSTPLPEWTRDRRRCARRCRRRTTLGPRFRPSWLGETASLRATDLRAPNGKVFSGAPRHPAGRAAPSTLIALETPFSVCLFTSLSVCASMRHCQADSLCERDLFRTWSCRSGRSRAAMGTLPYDNWASAPTRHLFGYDLEVSCQLARNRFQVAPRCSMQHTRLAVADLHSPRRVQTQARRVDETFAQRLWEPLCKLRVERIAMLHWRICRLGAMRGSSGKLKGRQDWLPSLRVGIPNSTPANDGEHFLRASNTRPPNMM